LEIATPQGSTAEQEPCGQDLNGGCFMGTPAFEPITMGETVNGTAWCDGNNRDTDWFIFTLTQRTRVTLTAQAEFPLLIGFISAPCPLISFINNQYGPADTKISFTSVLDPGTYYAFIAPANWSTIIQCGGADKYWATLTGNTCIEPTAVTASLITPTTVTISWTAPSPAPASGYSYELRTSGAPGSGSAGLTASGTTAAGVLSVAFSGLTPNTPYFAYVLSNCGGNSLSPWSAPAQFSTPAIDQNLAVAAVIQGNQTVCYDALQTITVAGGGTSFVIFTGGSATMIAGQNIIYLPGTLVVAGGYMHGYIAPGGPFCVTGPVAKDVIAEENEIPAVTEKSFFKIYPNPTTGNFTLEQKGEKDLRNVRVEVYGLRGDKIMTTEMINEHSHLFSLSGMAPGIYLIHVASEVNAEVFKIIKY
jgi:hypothetical protein